MHGDGHVALYPHKRPHLIRTNGRTLSAQRPHLIRTTAAPYPHYGRTLSAPTGSFRRVWDMLMAVLLLYTAFFTPFQVGRSARSPLVPCALFPSFGAPFLPTRVTRLRRPRVHVACRSRSR